MTQLEEQLRQELREIAGRVAPQDLRPLREPPARRGALRSRWLIPVAAAGAMASVATGLALTRPAAPRASAAGAHLRTVSDPPFVAVAGATSHGSASIRLISPRTGHVVETLHDGSSGSGFALSPDSTAVFATGTRSEPLAIRKISVATGKATVVAYGAFPAVSPDSRYLAYAAGRNFTSLAIGDLRAGTTRTISLSALIGGQSSILNRGIITWLADGRHILVVPNPGPTAASSQPQPQSTAATSCGRQNSPKGFCIIVVDVRPGRLTASRIYVPLPWTRHLMTISADIRRPRSFFVTQMGWPSPGAVNELTLRHAGTVAWHQVAVMPRGAMPVAIAPAGDRVLYLLGHAPPALWVATMRDGRLAGRHRLMTDSRRFSADFVAW